MCVCDELKHLPSSDCERQEDSHCIWWGRFYLGLHHSESEFSCFAFRIKRFKSNEIKPIPCQFNQLYSPLMHVHMHTNLHIYCIYTWSSLAGGWANMVKKIQNIRDHLTYFKFRSLIKLLRNVVYPSWALISEMSFLHHQKKNYIWDGNPWLIWHGLSHKQNEIKYERNILWLTEFAVFVASTLITSNLEWDRPLG